MSGLLNSVKYLTTEAKGRSKRVIKNTDSGLRRVELKTEIKGTSYITHVKHLFFLIDINKIQIHLV